MNMFYEKKCYKILVKAENFYESQVLKSDALLVPNIIQYECRRTYSFISALCYQADYKKVYLNNTKCKQA